MLRGHCQCGQLRYEVDAAPTQETACHCSICRRSSGAPFVAWFTVPLASFHFVQGEPSRFQSSAHGTRSFCPNCGTPITFQSTRHPQEIDVNTCSLDDPAHVPPRDHIYTSTRLPWVRLSDGLPSFPGSKSDP